MLFRSREQIVLEAEEGASYRWMDALGRPVAEGRLTENRTALSVAHLGRGTYFLRVEKEGKVQVLRVALID